MTETPQSHASEESNPYPIPVIQTWFEEFDLPAEVLAGLKDAGYTWCTATQAQAIPAALAGRDVVVQSRPEPGHALSFLVPLLTNLRRAPSREIGIPSALVLVPTDEIGRQIFDEGAALARHAGLGLHLVSASPREAEETGPVPMVADILVGTPGPIIDCMKQGAFRAGNIRTLVVDDADRFFEHGLGRDLRYLLRKLPHHEKRLSMLFSAGLSSRVLGWVYLFMNQPDFITEPPEESLLQRTEQSLLHVSSQEKIPLLLGLLKREAWDHALVFVNTRESLERVAERLRTHGLPAEGLTEGMPQRKRLRIMEKIERGQVKILVTTDDASRAVPLAGVSHVISYDLPQGPRAYLQRLGRISAPQGPGRVVSLACEEYVFHLEAIQEMLGYKLPVVWPQDDWFVAEEPPQETEMLPEEPLPVEAPPETPPRAEEPSEEKKAIHMRGGSKIVFSSEPGGVFGLAPVRAAASASSEPEKEGKKKPKRRRPRRTPKKD
ncbi:MAG: DEAD/DEAH box helicase [Deltaproteobacteria bacterium]|nr:DEAD/DEAH box helicase [Deltaproteobacteria bacterium]